MKKIKHRLGGVISSLLLLTMSSHLANAQSTQPGVQGGTMSDTMFIQKNILDNRAEVQLSKVALRKSKNEGVKSIAQQMVTDHTQILADLQRLMPANNTAGNKGSGRGNGMGAGHNNRSGKTGSDSVHASGSMGHNQPSVQSNDTSDADRNQMMGGDQDMEKMSAMQKATGKDFDTMWVSQMLTMHEAKLTELNTAAQTVTNPALKAAVNKAIPKIRMHRDRLQNLQSATTNSSQK